MNSVINEEIIDMKSDQVQIELINREKEDDVARKHPAEIWSFDCLMICACLGLGLNNKEIKKLCHKYELIPKNRAVDPGYGFFLLHHASHKKSYLTKHLTRIFNQRYRATIGQVRQTPTEAEWEWNGMVEEALQGRPMPILWALLTDPRNEVAHYGVYLAHHITMNSLQVIGRRPRAVAPAAETVPGAQSLEAEYSRLKEKVARAAQENNRLLKRLKKSRLKNEKLVKQADRMISRIAELEARPSREGKLERELRKARYELERGRTSKGEMVFDPADLEINSEEIQLACNDIAACPRISSLSHPLPADCPLEGLRVAIVGGLDRMESYYSRVVESLGAEFLFHNGKCRNGSYRLRNTVCQADIIVFITSCNSHSALQVVQATCRKTGKSFSVLRETGAASLKRILLKSVA